MLEGGSAPIGYAPAVYDVLQSGPPKPWTPFSPKGMFFSDRHAENVAYRVSRNRAI
jgi:hypothetical protein